MVFAQLPDSPSVRILPEPKTFFFFPSGFVFIHKTHAKERSKAEVGKLYHRQNPMIDLPKN